MKRQRCKERSGSAVSDGVGGFGSSGLGESDAGEGVKNVEMLEGFVEQGFAKALEVRVEKKSFVGGRVVVAFLNCVWFVGNCVENTVEEVVGAWVVVVIEVELGCDAVGNTSSECVEIEVGGKRSGVGNVVKYRVDGFSDRCRCILGGVGCVPRGEEIWGRFG
jgi:hypothetical protein